MVRSVSPQSTIVIGGHVAAIPGVEKLIDADHIVRGEGISWMSSYLGENDKRPSTTRRSSPASDTRSLGVNPPIPRANGGDDYSFGRMPDGLQLLHNFCIFRRQGQVHQFL